MNKQLDISLAFGGALQLLKNHLEIAVILLGLFLFVPLLAFELLMVPPELVPGMAPEQTFTVLAGWFAGNWYWFLLLIAMTSIGPLALMLLILDETHPTVGGALKKAAALFPLLMLTGLLQGLAVGTGLFLLIVPGIYLAMKFYLTTPIIAAEQLRNPLEILARSWALTKNNSLRIFALVMLAIIGGLVAMLAIGIVLNVILFLSLPVETATVISSIISQLTQTAFSGFICFLSIAVYQQLARSE